MVIFLSVKTSSTALNDNTIATVTNSPKIDQPSQYMSPHSNIYVIASQITETPINIVGRTLNVFGVALIIVFSFILNYLSFLILAP